MTTSTTTNNNQKNAPVIQLVTLFCQNIASAELIHNYHERLASLPVSVINPLAKPRTNSNASNTTKSNNASDDNSSAGQATNQAINYATNHANNLNPLYSTNQPILHTDSGFSYGHFDHNTQQANIQYPNHLLLPLLDSEDNLVNTALIPPVNDKGIQGDMVFEPVRHAKGALIIGSAFNADDDNAKVYLTIDIESAINLYHLYPTATILVCFTSNNLAYVFKQWQFKAKGRLIVPVACHELEQYKTLLADTTAIIYSMEYGIDFPLSNEETRPLIEGAIIYRLNSTDDVNALTDDEKQQLTWDEINAREPFQLLVNETGDPNPYPLNALPTVARNAVTAIAHHAQAPIAMAGQCVLGALSYLAQSYVNAYDRYSNKGKPCSLFILTEGGSGDRKSSCQRLADQRIYERQKTRMHNYHTTLEDYKNGLAQSRTPKQKAEFIENTPLPKNPQTLFKDATLEPIVSAFIRGDVHEVAWVSDEAGQIFGGHTLKGDNRESALGTLTNLWDKGIAERTRSRSNLNESGTAYDVRLTINTLGQKVVLQSVLNDPVMREQGFLPRFIFSAPTSLAGTRLHNSIESWKAKPYKDKRLIQYWQRCTQLLDMPPIKAIDGALNRPVIPLSEEAETMLLDLYNRTESQMSKSGRYAHFKPFASRTVEHAIRIATVLAFFEGIEAITPNLMQSGIQIAQYSLDEWERYNGFIEQDEKLIEADRLENWLLSYCRDNNSSCIPRATILQRVSPKHLRTAKNLNKVLKILTEQNHAREIKIKGKSHIELNPKVLTDK